MKTIEVDNILNLPKYYYGYTYDTKLDTVISNFKKRFGIDPEVIYMSKKLGLIAVPISIELWENTYERQNSN